MDEYQYGLTDLSDDGRRAVLECRCGRVMTFPREALDERSGLRHIDDHSHSYGPPQDAEDSPAP